MDQVDFGYVGVTSLTIYRMCFDKYTNALLTLKVPGAELSSLIAKTEEIGEKKLILRDWTF